MCATFFKVLCPPPCVFTLYQVECLCVCLIPPSLRAPLCGHPTQQAEYCEKLLRFHWHFGLRVAFLYFCYSNFCFRYRLCLLTLLLYAFFFLVFVNLISLIENRNNAHGWKLLPFLFLFLFLFLLIFWLFSLFLFWDSRILSHICAPWCR